MSSKPLMVDLFCGLGGWAEGGLSEGYNVIGFDIEVRPYPAQLVIQDVLTLHGSQFKDAALIVASPPCQEYSYMAMPWSRAKTIAREYRSGVRDVAKLKALFNACFRIQIEASHAAGRYIPLVVENVRGAQPWVGRSRWSYGSFHLWGDIPALMPLVKRHAKVPGLDWSKYGKPGYKAEAFNTTAEQRHRQISPAWREKHYGETEKAALKGPSGGWFNDNKRKGDGAPTGYLSQSGSKSSARKLASAQIAKIPFPLAQHIARVYRPENP